MKDLEIDIDDQPYYESLGFRCGLEIHQQIDTERKLFCHCPVGLTGRRHDAEILRHMRPTLSELGEYDGTALMEFKTKKEVVYRLYRDRTCTYEMDDTPPFLVNQQAVDLAIQIALHFNCRIVDELHVVRKQYLDGSIPTGFQRTMIIGIDGRIPYKGRIIRIAQLNLEEDSCREVSDIGHQIVFATDRLSIPLVEVITAADIKNPTEAAEVCRLLGNSMKAAGFVRRGIGTVRQDVNVSITGGNRVEIKGVYKVGNIKRLTAAEAVRQKRLLELRKLFANRFPSPNEIAYREGNFTALFSGMNNVIGCRLESDRPLKVVALLLPNLADIVNTQFQPRRDFGFELSGRVRVIACIDSRPNLFFHSQRNQYDIPGDPWNRIKTELAFAANDDIALVCGPSADVATAISEIKIRIAELADGVINETRQDLKDGTTDFERILPGPDRMYPDTDHPPVRITENRVEKNRVLLSEPLWNKQQRWRKLGLHEEQVRALSLSAFAGLFDRLAKDGAINIKKTAHYCTGLMVALRRNRHDLEHAGQETLYNLLKTALSEDWPYARVKGALTALADQNRTADDHYGNPDFEALWSEAERNFAVSGNNDTGDKFRRYITGQILRQYPDHTSQVLTRIKERLALK
ncbi:MAG: Glu-tRNA(Gln) amidotransferase subunit GatE [Candidatus Zixiibacteriota bacterium]|nr:MAG: Glu-tRNA(Gln) amidotransferase subunit GatE [candidate division Zixibacteria bacterium]